MLLLFNLENQYSIDTIGLCIQEQCKFHENEKV